jgi:ABC-2 type transport system permease protein
MFKGLWKLTWIETKVFVREPMGVFATLGIPLALFIVLGRILGTGQAGAAAPVPPPFNVPVLVALIIAVSAVISLVAIISIYREAGILKRLRATPLSPVTILSAQVVIKLVFTVISLALLVLAGRRFFPGAMDVNLVSFTVALLLSTLSILSLGFVIASVVPTARFAQPIAAAFLYPMIVLSGLFFPLDQLPQALWVLTQLFPTTHAVSLMHGVWEGSGWGAHWGSALALLALLGVCSGVSTRVFRWE